MKTKVLATFSMIPAVLFGSLFAGFVNKNVAEVDAATTFKYSTSDKSAFLDGYQLATSIYNAQSKPLDFSNSEKTYLQNNFKLEFDDVANKTYNIAKLGDYYWVEAFADENYTPKYLEVGEKEFSFNRINKQFIACADVEINNNARVVYERKLSVKAEDANAVLTSAYSLGKEEAENTKLLKDYEKACELRSEYEANLLAYNNYQKQKISYDLAKAEFEKYQIAKANYDEQYAKYQKYINEDLPKYSEQLAKYNKYLEELAVYEKNKDIYGEVYENYSQQMTIINSHLDILEILFKTYGDLQISAYDFINSNSVDVVIEQRGKIIAAGVEGAAVDNCKERTEAAKRLLKEYYALRNKDKSEKYLWYRMNYIPLKNNLVSLTACLEYFYSLSIVKNFIVEKGKDEKYKLFIAELIYFCDMLSKEAVDSYLGTYKLDRSRKLGGTAPTYPEMLKADLMDPNTDPIPLNTSFPVAPGEATAIKPAEVAKPIEIQEVKKPIAPTQVADPGEEPVEVKKPSFVEEPTKPNVVLRPEYKDLAEAFNNNELVNRTPVSGDITIKIEQKVDIDMSKVADVLILFDTRNGITPGFAKFREAIYFEDPNDATYQTKVTSTYGYISSVAGAGEIIFADVLSTCTDMSGVSAVEIIAKQEEALDKFSVKWVHVLDNEEHENYIELGNVVPNYGYELMLPTYGKGGEIPYQANSKSGGHIYKYNFVGFDYTAAKDSTLNGLSGLSTVADIAEEQGTSDNITVYAVFNKVEVFEVSFNNGETKLIEKGSKINPFVVDPSKPDTDSYCYVFAGWSDGGTEPVQFPYEVNANVEFKPLFETLNFYQIIFKVDGRIVGSQKVVEGSLPVAPTNIQKERIGNTCFEFAGWNPEVVAASENAVYVAKFNTVDFVKDVEFSETSNQFNLVAKEDNETVEVSNLLQAVKDEKLEVKAMKLELEDTNVELNASQVSYLANIGTSTLTVHEEKLENEEIEVQLILKDELGNEITDANLNACVTLNNVSDASHLRAFSGEDEIELNIVNNSTVSFITRGVSKLNLKYYYTVSFDKFMSALTFKLNDEDVPVGASYEFERGTKIQISATPNPGVKVLGLFTLDKNGRKTNLDENSIEICDSNLSVFADIEREIFTVNVYVDGKIFQQIKGTYGSLIALPTSVVKLPDNEFRYVFVGWDKEIETLTENVDVNAVFEKVAIDEAEGGEGVKSKGLTFAQKVAIGGLSLTIGGVVLASILVAKKLRKKPQN